MSVERCRFSIIAGSLALMGAAPWAFPAAAQADPAAVDRAFALFWSAQDPEAAAARVPALLASGVTYEDALARLRRGRPYPAGAPRGRRELTHSIRGGRIARDGLAHPFTVIVPERYDPSRAYPVRVQLHGGVGRPLRDPGQAGNAAGRLPGTREEIHVLPNAWAQSMWWQETQHANLVAILDRLKRAYNVDENRVYLTGISDGGTGAYFFALRDPGPFSSFLPLNGHMGVLANPDVGADGELFAGNAVNRPLFVVNGERDPLYPADAVAPFVEHLRELGAQVVFHVREDAGHDTSWWPDERAAFEAFVAAHPRDPLPDRLSWRTERTDRYNRLAWLIVDRLGAAEGESRFEDDNLLSLGGRRLRLFGRGGRPSGRVDVARRGNTVEVSTEGVRAFTLLLSPDELDLGQPVTVRVNGRVAFHGRVEPSLETLLRWAARDNDRTALFAAELRIDVGG